MKGIMRDLKEIGDLTLRQQMQALGLTQRSVTGSRRDFLSA
jgi:hypothetical protein